ncbi:PIN domain [Candidatus Electrothrix aarhusensis]|uniref:PIN domain n=1 Tax=Candidatus Electrothrix aarhusensis TaxID=1859131 RepID=A0A3S3R7A6_9BACT|nr:PIN domain [Candidatus Electrothrix aarhusensis]
MKKFVWDTSAIINIKEPNSEGYSPGYSLYKDLSDGWIPGPYQNIFPSLAVFEVSATVSRMHRDGRKILREFYIFDENSKLYDVDETLISKSYQLHEKEGFNQLRGADLVFACIAYVENAYLVTLDKHFDKHVSEHIKILNLNDSRHSANYFSEFE